MQARLREFAAAQPSRPWVLGEGWRYNTFPGGLPTRAQLDAAVPDRPAFVRCFDYHTAWVNSKALALAGITRDTPDPVNGTIVRDPRTGEPTGVLQESAQGLVSRLLPEPTMDERLAVLTAVTAKLHAAGVTSVQNALGSAVEFDTYERARRDGTLKPARLLGGLAGRPLLLRAAAADYERDGRRLGRAARQATPPMRASGSGW